MAKARQDLTSVSLVFIRDIYPLMLKAFGTPIYCGPWLAEQIAAGRVRWSAKATFPPNVPLDNFWEKPDPLLTIDFKNNTATKKVVAPPESGVIGFRHIVLIGLEVARQDIEALCRPKQAQKRTTSPQANRRKTTSTRGRDPELSDEEIAAAIQLLQTENKKERDIRGRDLKKCNAIALLRGGILRRGSSIPVDDRTWSRNVVWKVLPKRSKKSRTDK